LKRDAAPWAWALLGFVSPWVGSSLAEGMRELAAQALVVLGEFSVARVGGLQPA